jgi:hypothetical protein
MVWSTADDNREYNRNWPVHEASDGAGEKPPQPRLADNNRETWAYSKPDNIWM